MALKTLRRLRGIVTETAADTFTESTIDTNLSLQGNFVMQLHSLQWQCQKATDNEGALKFSLTRRSKTSVPSLSDVDMISRVELQNKMTTSGVSFMQLCPITDILPAPGLAIGETTLYLQIEGSGWTTSTASARVVINYELMKVTQNEFLQIVAQGII